MHRVQLARQGLDKMSGLALSQAAHYFWPGRDLNHGGNVGQPGLGHPAAAVGEARVEL